MRPFKRIAVILLSVVALIALLLIFDHFSSMPPKESKVIRDFRAHRGEYEQLRKMILDDKDVHLVATWGILAVDSPIAKMPPDGGMSIKRYQQYLTLLKESGALSVGRWENPPETKLLVWSSGFAGDTRHIAIAWLEKDDLALRMRLP